MQIYNRQQEDCAVRKAQKVLEKRKLGPLMQGPLKGGL